jgi:hypothetical protein
VPAWNIPGGHFVRAGDCVFLEEGKPLAAAHDNFTFVGNMRDTASVSCFGVMRASWHFPLDEK